MMMKTAYIWISLFLISCGLSAQNTDASRNWKILSEVSYEKIEDDYGEIYIPKFSAEVKKLNGQWITLEGFIVPFEGLFEPEKIIVSSLPIASCFFCGGSGPETVAEVHLKSATRYTAKAVRVRGRLVLNDEDYDQLMYVLKDASLEVL
jgi:hypothetical protein